MKDFFYRNIRKAELVDKIAEATGESKSSLARMRKDDLLRAFCEPDPFAKAKPVVHRGDHLMYISWMPALRVRAA